MAASTTSPPTGDNPRPVPTSSDSTSSGQSSQDGKTAPIPSTNAAIESHQSVNGDYFKPMPSDSVASAVSKKPGFSTRLSRMFSHRGDGPVLGLKDQAKDRDGSVPMVSPPAHGAQTPDLKERVNPLARQITESAVLKSQTNGNSEVRAASADKRKESTVATDRRKESTVEGPSRRFVMHEDGNHEHTLKTDKREEKLSNLFRNMLGKKKEGTHEENQLSLMSNWVDQLKSEKVAAEQKGGPNYEHTLLEKYGKCQEVVGRGAFGIVRISHKTDEKDPKKEQLYAVKEFRRRPAESPKKYNKRLTSEFCISSALRHPNVIHTLDLVKDAKGDFCEVMEYCAGGDLYTLVLAAGKLEVIEADCYFKQMMRGVEYIHEMGVAHRDLKPENLLLTTHGALKITDFGNGECFRMAWEKEPHMVAGLCGSAPYIAPEEYVDNEFDPRAVDVWACGVIYMAMRTGRHLWRLARKDEDEFYERYLEGRRDEDGYGPIETLHRARCRNVIYSILDPNPTRRITASQVLKSEWGREIKICKAGEEGF